MQLKVPVALIVLEECVKSWLDISHSWKKKEALKKAQRELNLPEHSLITECPTRWGTRQRMMERILEQQRALSQVLSENRNTRRLVPSWQDIEVLESVNRDLKPLQEFTDALSGEDCEHILCATSSSAAEDKQKIRRTVS
ncbi:hypothetical protein SRHO_G00016110 [Serrasalmus rhombeus]